MRLGSDVTNVRRNDLSECLMLYRSKVSLGRRLPMVPPRSRRMSAARTSFWTDGSGAPCRLCGASHRRLPQGHLRRNLKSHLVSHDFRSARIEARCLKKYMKSLTCVLSAQGPLGQPTQSTLPIDGIMLIHNDRFNRFNRFK